MTGAFPKFLRRRQRLPYTTSNGLVDRNDRVFAPRVQRRMEQVYCAALENEFVKRKVDRVLLSTVGKWRNGVSGFGVPKTSARKLTHILARSPKFTLDGLYVCCHRTMPIDLTGSNNNKIREKKKLPPNKYTPSPRIIFLAYEKRKTNTPGTHRHAFKKPMGSFRMAFSPRHCLQIPGTSKPYRTGSSKEVLRESWPSSSL